MRPPRPPTTTPQERRASVTAPPGPWLGESGTTVAEVLVAAALALGVLLVVASAVRVQARSAATQAGVSDTSLVARGTSEILLDDLRMTGYGMLGIASGSAPLPIETRTTGGVRTLVLRGNFSEVGGALAATATVGATSVLVTPAAGSGAFAVGNWVLVDSGIDSEVRTITAVAASGADVRLTLDSALTRSFPIGPDVTQVESVTYTWNGQSLRRNGQVLGDDVPTFTLTFMDPTGAESTTPGPLVRAARLDLAVRQPSPQAGSTPVTTTISVRTQLRNLSLRADAA